MEIEKLLVLTECSLGRVQETVQSDEMVLKPVDIWKKIRFRFGLIAVCQFLHITVRVIFIGQFLGIGKEIGQFSMNTFSVPVFHFDLPYFNRFWLTIVSGTAEYSSSVRSDITAPSLGLPGANKNVYYKGKCRKYCNGGNTVRKMCLTI